MRPKRILIFRQSSLGDVILTLPVLDRLKAEFPDCPIDYLTKTAYSPVLSNHPAVDRLYTFSNSKEFSKLASRMRGFQYSLLIDLQANLRSVLLRLIARPGRTLRYKKRRLAREMVIRRPQMKFRVNHSVNAYLDTLSELGIDTKPSHPVLLAKKESVDSAIELLKNKGIADSNRIVAFCPGARHPEKRWPHNSFRQVAEKLLDNPDTAIIAITSEADGIPDSLGVKKSGIIELRDYDLDFVSAVLSLCSLAITNDSGLMHLANAVGTRALAIFGPTNPRLGFAPALPGSEIICDDVFCSPCSVHGERPCRQREKYCFIDITPDRVYEIARKMLEN